MGKKKQRWPKTPSDKALRHSFKEEDWEWARQRGYDNPFEYNVAMSEKERVRFESMTDEEFHKAYPLYGVRKPLVRPKKFFEFTYNHRGKGYVTPKPTKVIRCVDCGEEVEVLESDYRTCRCEWCQNEKNKRDAAKRQARRRAKLKEKQGVTTPKQD